LTTTIFTDQQLITVEAAFHSYLTVALI